MKWFANLKRKAKEGQLTDVKACSRQLVEQQKVGEGESEARGSRFEVSTGTNDRGMRMTGGTRHQHEHQGGRLRRCSKCEKMVRWDVCREKVNLGGMNSESEDV